KFAQACKDAGIIFVGPRIEVLEQLGDKLAARELAKDAKVPTVPGSHEPVMSSDEAHKLAQRLVYPVLIKAVTGGGGRGMRVARTDNQLEEAILQASNEARAISGDPAVFLEKFISRARHIEVQLLGDKHGNLVHLFERDCSLQRRHQKIVEIAPAQNLDPMLRQRILDAALAVGHSVRLDNAGTVEFLLDADTGEFYFIEV